MPLLRQVHGFRSVQKEFKGSGNRMENRIPIIYLVDSAGVFLPDRTKFFQTKNTLEEFLETMPK